MAEDEQVKVTVSADVQPYIREVTKAATATTRVGTEVDKVTAKARTSSVTWAAAGTGITLFGAKAVRGLSEAKQAASGLVESQNKVHAVYGASSVALDRWAAGAAQSMGLSKQAAYDAVGGFGNMFTQIGFGTGQAEKMSTSLVQAAADMASFHNIAGGTAEVTEMVSAAMRGEYDSLQRVVPTINAAAVQSQALADTGKKNAQALTDQEKAAATYTLIMKGMGAAQGDFARSAGTAAQAQRIAQAEFENSKAALGEALLPVMTDATSTAADLMHVFTELPKPLQETAAALMGVVAVAALVAPGLTATYQAIKSGTTAWKAYRVASTEAAAADVAGNTARMASLSALSKGVIAAAAVGATAMSLNYADRVRHGYDPDTGTQTAPEDMGGDTGDNRPLWQRMLGRGQRDDTAAQMRDMARAMDEATIAGRSLDQAIAFKSTTGTIAGIVQLTAALGQGKAAADGVAPAFQTLDLQLSKMSSEAAKAAYRDLATRVVMAGGSLDDLNAALPTYIGMTREAARSAAELGSNAQSSASGLTAQDAALRSAAQSAFSYLGALNAAAGARLQTASIGDSLAAHLRSNSTAGSSSGSASRVRATDGESKALQRKTDAIRKADKAEEDAEVKAAQRRAKRKAEARADAEARRDVQKGVAGAIATDKAARAGKDIDGSHQTGTVGEAAGDLTKAEQKKLDKQIEGIRARHRKSVDAQVKALGEASRAQQGFAAAIDNASRSLDEHTAAGNGNLEWLRQQGATALQVGEQIRAEALARGDMEKEASRKAVAAILDYRDKLVDAMAQAGFSREAVEKYLRTLGLTPKTIKTKFLLDTDAFDEAIAGMKTSVRDFATWLHKNHPELGIGEVKGVTAKTDKYNNAQATWATGGYVTGAGSKTSDSIAARLSHGEYVMRAAAVDHYGAGFMASVNARSFAGGGPVSPRTFYGTARAGGSSSVTHGPTYGMYLASGAVMVTEATPARVRVAVMDSLAEQAYRSGAVR